MLEMGGFSDSLVIKFLNNLLYHVFPASTSEKAMLDNATRELHSYLEKNSTKIEEITKNELNEGINTDNSKTKPLKLSILQNLKLPLSYLTHHEQILENVKISYKPDTKIANRYNIYREYSGGQGKVYICYDDMVEIEVALKTVKTNDIESLKALIQEAETWINLEKHPNITRLYYLEEIVIDKEPVLVLALEPIINSNKESKSLRTWLPTLSAQNQLKNTLFIGIQLCDALIYAKGKSKNATFIHKDIKPENILVAIEDASDSLVIKLTDFGTSITSINQVEMMSGTWPYMAPELWNINPKYDFHVDIYAIGCVLYEVFTGKRAFERKIYYNYMYAHLYQFPEIEMEVKELKELIWKCIAKNPEERFTSVENLRVDLIKILNTYYGASKINTKPEKRSEKMEESDFLLKARALIKLSQIQFCSNKEVLLNSAKEILDSIQSVDKSMLAGLYVELYYAKFNLLKDQSDLLKTIDYLSIFNTYTAKKYLK